MSNKKIQRLEQSVNIAKMSKHEKVEFFRKFYRISQKQLGLAIGHNSGNYMTMILSGGRPLTDEMYGRLMEAIHDLAFKK